MRKSPWVVLLAVSLTLLSARPAAAQIDVGVHGLYNDNAQLTDGSVGVGARAGVELPLVGLGAHGDFNWYFPDCADGVDCEFREILGGVTYSVLPLVAASPYFGAGVALQNSSVDGMEADETGFNLLAGVELGGVSPINGYGEVSYRLMDDFENQLVISAGILF